MYQGLLDDLETLYLNIVLIVFTLIILSTVDHSVRSYAGHFTPSSDSHDKAVVGSSAPSDNIRPRREEKQNCV